MRKVTKIVGFCTLLALATVSCKKNTEPAVFSFKASINNPTCEDKNYIGSDNMLRWNAGDQVRVFVQNGNSAIFTTQDEGASVATFSGTIGEGEEYVAFYPAQNCTDNQDGKVVMTLPETQMYAANGFADDTYPLAATFSGPSTLSNFQTKFYSPCGILCLQLNGNAKIGRIELEDNFETVIFNQTVKHPLAGDLIAKVEGFDPKNPVFELPKPKDLRKTKITLDCSNVGGVQLTTTNKKFYFVVPNYPEEYLGLPNVQCQIFVKGFTAKIYDVDGNYLDELKTTKDKHIDPQVIKIMSAKTINVN